MEEARPSKFRLLSCVFGAYGVMMVTLFFGAIGQFLYWLIFDSFGREDARLKRKLTKADTSVDDDQYYALIIGSGFSGIGMAIRLRELGVRKFVIIERHHQLGGTWYANKYPGCACDVPSNLYSFSFEPNPNWSYYFGRQQEIGQYLEHCADKYGIREYIHFNRNVTRLDWVDDRQIWRIQTESNGVDKSYEAKFVVAGYGPLSNASFPTDIPGIDQFKGEMCHTAEWNQAIDFRGKRVAVVGTGASAIQTVPELHKHDLKELLVFQRTPAWVIPRADKKVSAIEKWLFTTFPITQKIFRLVIYWVRESTVLSFTYRWPVRFLNEELVRYNLRRQIKDPELRKALTPKFDLGCKRVLLTNDWYSTLQKPNVKLVTDRIAEITENGIVTKDGETHPVDVIVWSTGFLVQEFPLPIYGRNKIALRDQWVDSMQVSYINFFIFVFHHFL